METINSAIIITKQNRKWIWIVTVVKRSRNTGLTEIQNLRKSPGCWYYLFTILRIISIHFTASRYKWSNLDKILSINIKKNRREINNGQSSDKGNIWQRVQNDEKQEMIKQKENTKLKRWEITDLRCSRNASGSWILFTIAALLIVKSGKVPLGDRVKRNIYTIEKISCNLRNKYFATVDQFALTTFL
jgi:hypothetical protein